MSQKIDSEKQLSVPNTVASDPGYGGTSHTYHQYGELLICSGALMVAASAVDTTFNFAKAFQGTPTIVLVNQDPSLWYAWVRVLSSTAATLRQQYTGSSLRVRYIAIGKAA